MVDTTGGEVRAYPTAAKCAAIAAGWEPVLARDHVTVGDLDTLLGKLAFVAGATKPLRVFLHPLYQARHAEADLDTPPEHRIHLTPQLRAAVADMLHYLRADNPLFHLRVQACRGRHLAAAASAKWLTTDASGDTGYGYASATKAQMGVWQQDELAAPIHAKELAAVVLGVAAHAQEFAGHQVLVWSDNQAVVAILNSYKPHATTVGHLRALVRL